MIKKIVVTFLFLFSANYSQDCPVKPTGLTVCEKKMDKTFVSIELEKTRRETSKACFPYWDGYSFPDISIKLSVDGNIIFFPKELYCTIALVNDFSVKKRNKDFILFGSSGDASETVYFEVFFDEEKVYKSFTFERVDKKDTISTCTYRPVFYQ